MNFITAKASAKSSVKDSKTSMKKTRQLESSTKVTKAKSATKSSVKTASQKQIEVQPEEQVTAPQMSVVETTQIDVLGVKTKLIAQKKDILNKSYEFRSAQSERPQVSEEAEAASLDVNHSLSIHLHERDRSALYMIERALSKITEGTYGICESCSAQISSRRLSASPFTPICIDCAEEQEARLN